MKYKKNLISRINEYIIYIMKKNPNSYTQNGKYQKLYGKNLILRTVRSKKFQNLRRNGVTAHGNIFGEKNRKPKRILCFDSVLAVSEFPGLFRHERTNNNRSIWLANRCKENSYLCRPYCWPEFRCSLHSRLELCC